MGCAIEKGCNYLRTEFPNLILEHGENFLAHTYPMNYAEMTGLPCRVIAEI